MQKNWEDRVFWAGEDFKEYDLVEEAVMVIEGWIKALYGMELGSRI